MHNLGLFRYLQPSFFAGLFDDPLLFINARPSGRGILFDCGQLHHLAKRVLRAIDALFISHAHMDHLIGFDHLLRHIHVAPRTLTVFGPPGIADRIGHKLAGYDWNLAEESWGTIEVHEVHPRHIEQARFPGSRGYRPQARTRYRRQGRTLWQTADLKVEAELCDHKIPVLAFRVTEREAFLIDRQKMISAGLRPGPWLKELKRRFHAAAWDTGPIDVLKMSGDGTVEEEVGDVAKLYQTIRRAVPPASIGFLTDVGMTSDNLVRIRDLLRGVSLLIAECSFLRQEQDKARAAAHLCSSDLNIISREVGPRYLMPMHLSKAYIGESQRLYDELDPPQGTQLLLLPDYLTPRPMLPCELPQPITDSRPNSHVRP